MLDILKFIFSDLFIFIGTVILLGVIFDGIKGLITINIKRD